MDNSNTSSSSESTPNNNEDGRSDNPPFSFVHSTGEVRHNNPTKRLIRSHVMRKCHRERREKRLQSDLHPAKNRPLIPNGVPPTLSALLPANTHHSIKKRPMAIGSETSTAIKPPGEGAIQVSVTTTLPSSSMTRHIQGHNPFDVLPITSTPRIQTLLHNSTLHAPSTS